MFGLLSDMLHLGEYTKRECYESKIWEYSFCVSAAMVRDIAIHKLVPTPLKPTLESLTFSEGD